MLNAEGVPAKQGGRWSATTVYRVVANPVHVGDLCHNKKTTSLAVDGQLIRFSREQWLRVPGDAFEPLIERSVFDAAERLQEEAEHDRSK